jgi:hypothetical protein
MWGLLWWYIALRTCPTIIAEASRDVDGWQWLGIYTASVTASTGNVIILVVCACGYWVFFIWRGRLMLLCCLHTSLIIWQLCDRCNAASILSTFFCSQCLLQHFGIYLWGIQVFDYFAIFFASLQHISLILFLAYLSFLACTLFF